MWRTHETQFWLRGEQPEKPVCFDESAGLWHVYGYPEVQAALADPATFSSDLLRITPEHRRPRAEGKDVSLDGMITLMDPPQHTKLRKLVTAAFAPRAVASLEPQIAALTNELLDEAGTERLELVTDLAFPLPVIVIADILGVPREDRDLFQKWVAGMFERNNQPSQLEQSEERRQEVQKHTDSMLQFRAYIAEHAAERRKKPREDLLTTLVVAEIDGKPLTDDQVVNFAFPLLIAGHLNTTMLLGNTVLCLDAFPEVQDRVRADRSIIPAVIEESMRFLTPFAALSRATTREVELGGEKIPADQMLMVWLATANRDPRVFPNPDTFDPSRGSSAHVAFGWGIHFCLGALLGRVEGRVVLNILLDRYPSLRTIPDEPPEFLAAALLTGLRKLPLRLSR
ncbi:cytochrome P450 [Micromonospora sp. CPCC 206061]|uniref:cytochrome P450 n=1 Tax=Micromonospora sp. CPCC 206061 TaxID=3122410 RepID=UPI002FF14266